MSWPLSRWCIGGVAEINNDSRMRALWLATLTLGNMFVHAPECEALARAVQAHNVAAVDAEVHVFAVRTTPAFVFARRHVTVRAGAVLAVNCRRNDVGVAFRDFVVGADCSTRRLIAVNATEAWPPNATRSRAMRVAATLAVLDAWTRDRHCAVTGGEKTHAAVFWAFVIAFYAALVRRPWPVPNPLRAPQ